MSSRKLVGLSLVPNANLPTCCAGCLYWEHDQRLPKRCGAFRDVDAADRWARRVAAEWGECGRVAVADGETLGFIKYAPPGYLGQAAYMPAGPPDAETVMIACLHVDSSARGRGLGGVLLRAALRDLSQRGERAVQVYADAAEDRAEGSPMIGMAFCLRNGFVVERPHPEFPLMRLDLKSLVSWTENLEAVLESLRLPIRVPGQAPVTLSVPKGDS